MNLFRWNRENIPCEICWIRQSTKIFHRENFLGYSTYWILIILGSMGEHEYSNSNSSATAALAINGMYVQRNNNNSKWEYYWYLVRWRITQYYGTLQQCAVFGSKYVSSVQNVWNARICMRSNLLILVIEKRVATRANQISFTQHLQFFRYLVGWISHFRHPGSLSKCQTETVTKLFFFLSFF